MCAATSQDKEAFNDYEGFVEKFKPKKTTDDCYTPQAVYDVILEWVRKRYNLSDTVEIVRPFWPGGDFENYDYKPGCVVIDNPPFSILSKIVAFYNERNIKYFLFAPGLIALGVGNRGGSDLNVNHICTGATITYENGAKVSTSFVTNLRKSEDDRTVFETEPELFKLIAEVQNEDKPNLPKYKYPTNVITAAMLNLYSKRGLRFSADRDAVVFVRSLDNQRQLKKTLFGGGYIMSDNLAAEHFKIKNTPAVKGDAIEWELSDRERAIINQLNKTA